jgi:L-iditol 2-dehydrogenase
METMNAVVVHDGQTFHYEKIEKPHAGPGELVLEIEAAGICAADRKIYSGEHPWELPDRYIPGHEYVGRVTEMGPGAEAAGLELGDRVTAEIVVPCRTCWYCHQGLYHLCDEPGTCVGAWAEYLKVPAGAIIHRVSESLSAAEAVLVEPLACSIHGVELAEIGLRDTVVIGGLGAIGMGMLQVARLKSPRHIVGLDLDDDLLDIAQKLGADHTLNPAETDVDAHIRELTHGRGCDIYIEASGSPASISTGLQVLRKAGRLVIFGVYGRQAEVDFNQISEFKELTVRGGHLSPNTYPSAIRLLEEEAVDASSMVTHTFPLFEFEEAIAVKGKAGATSIKTVLTPP